MVQKEKELKRKKENYCPREIVREGRLREKDRGMRRRHKTRPTYIERIEKCLNVLAGSVVCTVYVYFGSPNSTR